MTTSTDTTHPDCRCGHDRNAHFQDGFAPQCTAPHCICLNYQPETEPVTLRPANDNGTSTSIDQLVAAGRRSSTKRIATLANRIHGLAAQLHTALEVERGHAEIARQIARLERELAAAKASLKTKTTATHKPPSPPPPVKRDSLGRRVPAERATQICPDCGQSFANLGVHRARRHGYRKNAP